MSVYNGILALVWLALSGRSAVGIPMAAAHAAAAIGVPWLLRRLPHRMPSMARWLREGYPLALLALFWIELGPLQALRGIKPHDAWVQALDLAVFGVHWQAIWMDAMPAAWLSEAMHFGYLLYYFFLLIPPVAIAAVGGQRAFRSTVLAIMATYLTCFLFYLAFPVYGPHALAGETAHAAPGGLFHALVDRARATGDSPGTAFPSSHVAGAFTLAWLGWRWLGRGWGAVLVTLALAVALSTVYTRNHYAIDAVVGLLWILPLQGWLVPALERRWPGPADQRTATQPTASRLG